MVALAFYFGPNDINFVWRKLDLDDVFFDDGLNSEAMKDWPNATFLDELISYDLEKHFNDNKSIFRCLTIKCFEKLR